MPHVTNAADGARRDRLRQASGRLVAVLGDFADRGRPPMLDLLGDQVFTEWSHYPEDDLFDPETGILVFYHAHSQEDRPAAENGHFHCFVEASRVAAGSRAVRREGPGSARALCHIAGLSIDPYGLPCEVFTTNQWVTGERLYPEPVVASLLPRFAEISASAPRVLRWVAAMITLFEPQVHDLLRERDHRLGLGRPGARARADDRAMDIVAAAPIDIGRQLDWVDRL